MDLAMVAHIIFPAREGRGKLEIRKITGVKIESGWEMLTSTATILLARNVKFFDNQKVKEVFKPGDPVEIYLGYNQTLVKEFVGFVAEVSADIPIKIRCEDAMYTLKRHPANISIRQATVSGLLSQILPEGFQYDAIDANIGSVRYSKTTVSQILETLKSDFGLYSYIKDHNTLVCGKIYQDDDNLDPVRFNFHRNVIDNKLNYRRKEEVLIKIIAVSTLSKGNKIQVEVGDDFGVEKQLSYYNIQVKAELEKLALLDLQKFKIDGFDGSFTAFGIPSVTHGMKAELISPQYPERNGLYWIKKVVKVYDDSPKYRQMITLDQKV